jgi:uncharacterized protein
MRLPPKAELIAARPAAAESGGTADGLRGMTVKTDLRALVRDHRDEILRIAASHGARNVRLFGSVARGDYDEDSDIDFLIELEPRRSLLDLGALLMDLRELLERRVDVVPDNSIPAYSREAVLAEAVQL